MRTALIIGASGRSGRLLAQSLSNRSYRLVGWIRQATSKPASFPCAVVDLLNINSVERELQTVQPDEIYYLAAFHHSTEDALDGDTCELLRRSFDTHVGGLLNVLQAMKQHVRRARLFYAASSHVFGNAAGEWADQTTPLRPNSAYGISKAAGMRCCQLLRKQDRVFASTGVLFHHDSSLRKPSFVSQKIVRGALQARRDPSSKIAIGHLDALADWGYAPDYVEAMFRILQLAEPADFVIASGELHSVGGFVEAAFEEVGLNWREHVESDARILKRDSHPLRGDAAKLRSL